MDHAIENVDECIFDYLVSNADEFKSIPTIFSNIIKETGHRCITLKNEFLKYKNKFIATCYLLNNSYNNIHKIFINDRLYLMYSNKHIDSYDDYTQNITDDYIFDADFSYLDKDGLAYYISYNYHDLTNFNPCNYLDDIDSIMHFIVKRDNHELVKKTLDRFECDKIEYNIDNKNKDGLTLMNIAETNGNFVMYKKLLDIKYEKYIKDLNENIVDLNKRLKMLKMKNIKLKNTNIELTFDNTDLIQSNVTYKYDNNVAHTVSLMLTGLLGIGLTTLVMMNIIF
jgi:hypothetical protein